MLASMLVKLFADLVDMLEEYILVVELKVDTFVELADSIEDMFVEFGYLAEDA